MSEASEPVRSRMSRIAWLSLGGAAVAVGSIGIVVPGLPTTIFFIIAAWAFSKSSPRLEAWVLGLPKIGPMVQDYRNGLGMPKRAKIAAVTMIAVFGSISLWVVDRWWIRAIVLATMLAGVAFVLRVPTNHAASA